MTAPRRRMPGLSSESGSSIEEMVELGSRTETAYLAFMERQKQYGGPRPKNSRQKGCPHLRTYLTDSKIRDYPDGEWIALPVHRMCRDCWWPEPVL